MYVLFKFLKSVISSANTIVKLCGNLVLNGTGSTICKNINYIWYKHIFKYSKYEVANYATALNNMKLQCCK